MGETCQKRPAGRSSLDEMLVNLPFEVGSWSNRGADAFWDLFGGHEIAAQTVPKRNSYPGGSYFRTSYGGDDIWT